MEKTLLDVATRLSDDELVRRVRLLAIREREATVELVAHLAELDTRKLYLAQGYSSLFTYCTEVLRLAEHAAYNRIEAARASRRFPAVLDRLAGGSLNLSTLRLLAPHLTSENHASVLDEAAGKSKREVELLVARLAPRPDMPVSVRRLPSPKRLSRAPAGPAPDTSNARHVPDAAATFVTEPAALESDGREGSAAVAASTSGATAELTLLEEPTGPWATPSAIPTSRPVIAALSTERYRVQFTVGRETHERLRRVQDLLRREIPDGDPGMIFDRALKLLFEDIARKKLAATSQPRPGRATAARSRHIPADVKRAVWLRDGDQCAFVARSGRRCRERAFLEFHHVEPYAIGGEATAANLSVRCRAHNIHEAELLFGPFAPVACGSAQDAGARARLATRPGAS